MSRRTMPYHRRYHGDALTGYRKLDLEERGAYTTVLDLIYDAGGPIENNERWLAGELNCSLRKSRAILSKLLSMQKIYITIDGKISNHRCEQELDYALKTSRKQAENGSKPKRKSADDVIFRNKISDDEKPSLSHVETIPDTRAIYKDNTVGVALGGDQFVDNPPVVPVAQLTSNNRLIRALESHGPGKAIAASLAQQQRIRRIRGGGA